MPALTRDIVSSAPDMPETVNQSHSKIWVIVVFVFGSILLAAVFVTAILVCSRRREYREAKRRNPSLSREEFLRKRKMSAVARQEEEELQRHLMIRKSLASRSTECSSRAGSPSLSTHDNDGVGLKDDWKEWEARMHRERRLLAHKHPSATLPDVPTPVRPRPRSPSRSPLLRGQSPSLIHEPHRRAVPDTSESAISPSSEPTQPGHVYGIPGII